MRLLSALLGLALAATLVLQWRDWPPPRPSAPTGPAAAAPAQPSGVDESSAPLLPMPPREDYASVVERPLFLPERRPPPDDEGEDGEEDFAEEPAELGNIDLSAVVITPDAVKAWVLPHSQERRWLRIGDEIDGWTLTHIGPDSLVLERQGERNEVVLRDYDNAPAPIPPTPRPPPRLRRPDPAQAAPRQRGDERPATRQAPRPASAEAPGRGGTERAPPGARQPPRTDATQPARPPRDEP
jgi:hypothetical protein